MITTMQTVQEQIEDCLSRKKLLKQAFDVIMELTLEEKEELLKMWKAGKICSRQKIS